MPGLCSFVAVIRRLRLGVCLATAMVAGTGLASAQPKHVLLLFDEDHSLPGLTVLKQSFRSALTADLGGGIEFFTESMNVSQFPDERYGRLLAEYYRKKYAHKQLDLLVTVMGPALAFAVEHAAQAFPGVPIVFVGPDAADLARLPQPPQATGVLLKRVFAPTLATVLHLQPDTRHVVVVGGSSAFDRHLQAEARREFEPFSNRVSIEYYTDIVMSDLLEAVSRLPSRSVVLYLTMFRDKAGQTFVPHFVAGRLAEASNAPVYAFVDQYIGTGVVGGYVYSLERHAGVAAQVAARVLRGEAPSSIPVRELSSAVAMFDARQLIRWGLDEKALPADSVVRFRELTIWQRYRSYVIAVIAALVAQSALLAALLVHRSRRRRAETELRVSFTRIRELGRRVMTAQEEERTHLARELHDDVSQQLAVLKVDLQLLGRTLDGDSADAVLRSVTQAEAIATSVHDLSHRLHPARLRFMGLASAVESLASELSRTGVSLTVTHDELPPHLDPDLTLAVFRVVQEALHNAVKHGQANDIVIRLRADDEALTAIVTDNGAGFDVGAAWGGAAGIGLISMRERIEALNGTVAIRSTPHRGTEVKVSVPLPKERPSGVGVV